MRVLPCMGPASRAPAALAAGRAPHAGCWLPVPDANFSPAFTANLIYKRHSVLGLTARGALSQVGAWDAHVAAPPAKGKRKAWAMVEVRRLVTAAAICDLSLLGPLCLTLLEGTIDS